MTQFNPSIEILPTKDGSSTLRRKDLDETYHSIHGAKNEAQHVFINNGLSLFNKPKSTIKVFEMGFGSGLNALMALNWANSNDVNIQYTSIENFPVSLDVIAQTDYTKKEPFNLLHDDFYKMHQIDWGKLKEITDRFKLLKIQDELQKFEFNDLVDVIFFDAFSPTKQPELWELSVFKKMYSMLKPSGILVTYCAKGYVRRNMIAAGFDVQKLPGPPGKREMLRARKV